MLKNLIKLTISAVLNQGIRGSKLSDVAVQVEENDGVYVVGTGTVVTIEAKRNEDLTPRERWRKNLIFAYLLSLLFMITLSTIGALTGDANAGRWLILISEVPAFVSSLASTRLFMKRPKMKPMAPEQPVEEMLRPPVIVPPKVSTKTEVAGGKI
jgi:hypothetical protein